jgi:hypothetical protein
MCEAEIQKIVCLAVVSERFRAQLLGVEREDVLRASDLDKREQSALLEIPAETIEEFAAGVERVTRMWKQGSTRNQCREFFPFHNLIPVEVPRREG